MSPKNDSFSVRIFAPAGFERGFRIIERDNWNGKGVTCKRSVFPLVQKREEFSRPGTYFLYWEDFDGATHLYVGEGDPILNRLQSHHKTKDAWTDLIAFFAADNGLTKAHIQYIEARLVNLAHDAKKCKVENGNRPTLPSLPEAEVAYAHRFLENALECLAALNITFFHVPERNESHHKQIFLFNRGKGANAQGFQSDNGFTVIAGSTATKQLTASFNKQVSGPNLRSRLIENGVLADSGDGMRFTQNYEFDSPSAAATVIYGNAMNGREEWKTEDGRTLKQVQEAEVA